jgi:signal transduction histidine kinase
MIHVAGEHVLTLVDEIMDLSRIEAGAMGISTETVSLRSLVEEAFQLMRPVAAGNGIVLHEPVFDRGVTGYALADRQRLTQVIINLVSNAIRSMARLSFYAGSRLISLAKCRPCGWV